MMRYLILFFSCVLFYSCNQEQKDTLQSSRVNIAKIEFPETSIALVGNAQKIASEWEEYRAFEVAFENYDHSPAVTKRLATLVENMRDNLINDFDNQPIRSRILVLETRLKRYASFLEYNDKPESQYLTYYSDIIQAVDQLNGQLNEKDYYDQLEQELYEELKSDLRDLDAVASDTLP